MMRSPPNFQPSKLYYLLPNIWAFRERLACVYNLKFANMQVLEQTSCFHRYSSLCQYYQQRLERVWAEITLSLHLILPLLPDDSSSQLLSFLNVVFVLPFSMLILVEFLAQSRLGTPVSFITSIGTETVLK